jgi:hypothetical protein
MGLGSRACYVVLMRLTRARWNLHQNGLMFNVVSFNIFRQSWSQHRTTAGSRRYFHFLSESIHPYFLSIPHRLWWTDWSHILPTNGSSRYNRSVLGSHRIWDAAPVQAAFWKQTPESGTTSWKWFQHIPKISPFHLNSPEVNHPKFLYWRAGMSFQLWMYHAQMQNIN